MSFTGDLREIVEENDNGLLGAHSSWARIPLGEIATLLNGFPFDSKHFSKSEGVPLIRIRDILGDATDTRYTGPVPEGYWVHRGDLLVGMDGDFNCARWRGGPAVLNQRVCKIEGDPQYIVTAFLHRVLGGYLAAINSRTSSLTVKHLSSKTIAAIPLPYPPLAEQTRIGEKLDAVLARVDACRESLDRVPSILKRFRQSVLAAATSGELTREWREERGLDSEWPVVELEHVASDFSYGSAAKSSKAGKVPVLRMGNIQNGVIDWGDLVFTSDAAEISKYRLSTGDVLFNRTNSPELVGKTAVFRGERHAIYAGYLIRVRCGERLLPDYLNYCLGSPSGREYCWRVKSDGVSQSNINARKLAAFTFGLPSVEEQREIIRRVEELLELNVTLGAQLRRARVLADRLTPSALGKAFRGELVPQDPTDEPASALLAKLRVARSNAAAEPSRRRPRAPGKRPIMSNGDKELIKAAILKLKTDRFSFDDLKAQVSGDYEPLKAALFELLEEPSPVIRQVFDKAAKEMRLVRVRL